MSRILSAVRHHPTATVIMYFPTLVLISGPTNIDVNYHWISGTNGGDANGDESDDSGDTP